MSEKAHGSATYSVAVIPGDGIGTEVMPPALDVLDTCARQFGFRMEYVHYDWGSQHYRETGRMMPQDGLDRLATHDSILFGAVGAPDIPDTVTLWGLLIPIRRTFRQYVNLRPVRHVPGVPSPLADPNAIDIVVVRENVEGEYSDIGAREGSGRDEYATQLSRFTRAGIERVAAYAARTARSRSGVLTSATKSNGLLHTMPFWDDVVAEVAAAHDVQVKPMLIDALAARMVARPQEFDVIVASNLFGDILSDLTAACVGSLGLAASANLNPECEYPSLFEPVHGSAPDIAGKEVANPLAQIAAAAMMLDQLGEYRAGNAIREAIDITLGSGPRTGDLGGKATTSEVGAAVVELVAR